MLRKHSTASTRDAAPLMNSSARPPAGDVQGEGVEDLRDAGHQQVGAEEDRRDHERRDRATPAPARRGSRERTPDSSTDFHRCGKQVWARGSCHGRSCRSSGRVRYLGTSARDWDLGQTQYVECAGCRSVVSFRYRQCALGPRRYRPGWRVRRPEQKERQPCSLDVKTVGSALVACRGGGRRGGRADPVGLCEEQRVRTRAPRPADPVDRRGQGRRRSTRSRRPFPRTSRSPASWSSA